MWFLLDGDWRECNEIIQIKLLLTSRALLVVTEKSCRHSWHFNFVIFKWFSSQESLMNLKGHLCLALQVAIHLLTLVMIRYSLHLVIFRQTIWTDMTHWVKTGEESRKKDPTLEQSISINCLVPESSEDKSISRISLDRYRYSSNIKKCFHLYDWSALHFIFLTSLTSAPSTNT